MNGPLPLNSGIRKTQETPAESLSLVAAIKSLAHFDFAFINTIFRRLEC